MAEIANPYPAQFSKEVGKFLTQSIQKSAQRFDNPYPVKGWFDFMNEYAPRGVEGALPWTQVATHIAEEGMTALNGDTKYQRGLGFHEFLLGGIEIAKEMGVVEGILSFLAPHIETKLLPVSEIVSHLFHPDKFYDERSLVKVSHILKNHFLLSHADEVIRAFYRNLTDKQGQYELLQSIPTIKSGVQQHSAEQWLTFGDMNMLDKMRAISVRRNTNSIANLISWQECWNHDKNFFNLYQAYEIVLDYNLTIEDVVELADSVFSQTDHKIGLIEFAQICMDKQNQKIVHERDLEVESGNIS